METIKNSNRQTEHGWKPCTSSEVELMETGSKKTVIETIRPPCTSSEVELMETVAV